MPDKEWHRSYTRVRYAETDQAGVVYHSNYFVYFEIGRTDVLREREVPYRKIEEEFGIILAVVDCSARFRHPARYDDYLRIETAVTGIKGTRIFFAYKVFRDDDNKLLCDGNTVLAAVKNGKPVRLPDIICESCGFQTHGE
ncbi:acyl-CoA thioesterase [Planctomycetota bacterium]